MARRMRLTRPLAAEVLRQLEALVLIAGGRVRAVEGIRRAGKLFVHQPPDRLAVLQQERHIAAPHFQDRPSGWAPVSALPEAWIEEARIMNAKLPNRRIDRRHFRCKVRGYLDALPRSQNVELVGIEDQAPVLAGANRLPEMFDGVAAQAVNVDDVAVLDRLVADDRLAQTSKIDPQHHALAQVEWAVDQRAGKVPLADLGIVEGESVSSLLFGIAASKSDLAQFRPHFDADAEATG